MSHSPEEPSWHLSPGQPTPEPTPQPTPPSLPESLYAPLPAVPSDQAAPPAPWAEPIAAPQPPRQSRRAGTLVAVGIIGAGAIAGVVAVSVLHLSGSQASTASPGGVAAQSGQSPGQAPGVDGQGFRGQGQGGLAGEQRLAGIITAVGSGSVTVKTAAGTEEYLVDDQTQIVRDGAQASLSGLKVGDAVFVHVYPLGGKLHVERIFAGQLPAGGFGGPGGPPGTSPAPSATT